jgi:hypothetical protein
MNITETVNTHIIDLKGMSPAEIDARLFPLWAQRWRAASRAYSSLAPVAHTLFPQARFYERVYTLNQFDLGRFYTAGMRYKQEQFDAEAQIAPFADEFDRRGGWTRYVLVITRKAKGGHLHYRGCPTLKATTECILVAEASGLDANQVVGHFGETACSHCFKNAPAAR